MKKIIRITDGILLLFMSIIFCLISFGSYSLPENVNIVENKSASFSTIYEVSKEEISAVDYRSDGSVTSNTAEIKLFGKIPVKTISVTRCDSDKVLVSGEVFGIKIYTKGVMVVGTKDISIDGETVNPAKDSGIEVGDIIVSINGQDVTISTDVEKYLSDNNGLNYRIRVLRDNKYKTFTLTPVYSQSDGCYKAGLWVRDSTAGIGTITFYSPSTNTVAALGHPITDVDSGEIMPILKGEAVDANITKIYKSTSGNTGSICCDFTTNKIAELTENTQCGIYGKYDVLDKNLSMYEIAPSQEVEKGDCQILTTVTDGEPQLYNAKIVRINYKNTDEQKNLIIKVTDEKLLKLTGGIVQGMSGSPIIQNGKLVGALTHVIVNEPNKGYAIFAESMLKESENIE